jgi:hypothetical protein
VHHDANEWRHIISRSAAHLEREFERQVLLALDRAVEQASKMCAELEDEWTGTTVHGPSMEHSSDRIERAAARSAASTAKTVKISAAAERTSLAHASGKEEGTADLDQDFPVSGFLRAQFRNLTDILILLVRQRDLKLALLFDEAALLNHDL